MRQSLGELERTVEDNFEKLKQIQEKDKKQLTDKHNKLTNDFSNTTGRHFTMLAHLNKLTEKIGIE